MGPDALQLASQLFVDALGIVRSADLTPRDRPPAITLPKIAARRVLHGHGPVDGPSDDVWATAAAIADRRLSVTDVVGRAQASIAAHDRRFGAFEFIADVGTLARQLDDESVHHRRRGPLHGIPITVKDIIDVAGMPTTGSSRAYPARIADRDATAVHRLRQAGALIMGKVVTHELALGVTTPQSKNPWDPTRIPGGSSGGSAISVLTGMALASLGTDTRASIRVPAALCGLVGLKPSLDLVPRDGWITLSWTMDHIAPMTRSVRDAARLLDVLTGRGAHHRGLLPQPIAGTRIGWAPSTTRNASPEVASGFDTAMKTLEQAGAAIIEQAVPTDDDLTVANAVGMVLSRVQATQYHAELGTDFELLTPEVRDQLHAAATVEATAYVRALRLRALLRERLEAPFDTVDVLAMPTCKTVAPRTDDAHRHLLALSENCVPWSLLDFPAISLPVGNRAGLPIGLQIVAPPGQDDDLLAIAHAMETTLPNPARWVESLDSQATGR